MHPRVEFGIDSSVPLPRGVEVERAIQGERQPDTSLFDLPRGGDNVERKKAAPRDVPHLMKSADARLTTVDASHGIHSGLPDHVAATRHRARIVFSESLNIRY